jgi:hypothetical protein
MAGSSKPKVAKVVVARGRTAAKVEAKGRRTPAAAAAVLAKMEAKVGTADPALLSFGIRFDCGWGGDPCHPPP